VDRPTRGLMALVVNMLRRRHALRGVRAHPTVVLRGDPRNLTIARGVEIQALAYLHAGGFEWCQWVGHIEVGEGGVIGPGSVLFGAGPGGIVIGRGFDGGPHVGIFASRTDFDVRPRSHLFGPVRIGDEVTVFAGAVISPGVTIGDGAVVAANAVVTNDVEPYTLVGGAPARVIRRLSAAR
jgi:acetyltransferase-like isoleucine patch superfamily enzyme